MRYSIRLLAGAAILVASLGGHVYAQGAPQTIAMTQVDPSSLATGYRTSKVVGSVVVNENTVTIGTVDDLIVTPTNKVTSAVVSVGGFLGVGTRYVVVPTSAFEMNEQRIMLRGATKESLKDLPEFKYAG